VSIAAGHEVAVKVFKGEASPDGRAADEIDVTCAVAHPNLIRVIGLVQQPHALVVHKVGLTLDDYISASAPCVCNSNLGCGLRCSQACHHVEGSLASRITLP
jgi:hypothetical protein